jgi:probable rRNA maturation factor
MPVTLRNRQRSRPLALPRYQQLAEHALALLGDTHRHFSIVLVSDPAMARYNEQFHHVAGPTDVLSFDYGPDADPAGEIIVSVDHAHHQARRYGTTPARELALYIIHGLLHLHGYDDLTGPARRRMRAAERRLLKAAGF